MTSDRMVTPEAVTLDLETANVGSRLLAYMLDSLVVWTVSLILAVMFSVLGVSASVTLPTWLVVTVYLLLSFGWYFGYFIALETLWRGRTLGKAALGLRVVTREGGQVRFRHALLRTVLGLVDFAISGGFVAVVTILSTRSNQRLGDMVAGTLVLRERTGARAPAAVTFAPPRGLESYTRMLDTSRVTAREYQMARSFLLRASSLLPDARRRLATRLADQLAELVAPPPPRGLSAEAFLGAVAAAYQQRQQRAARSPDAMPRLQPPQPLQQPQGQPPPAAAPATRPAPPPPAAPARPATPAPGGWQQEDWPEHGWEPAPAEPTRPRHSPPPGGFVPPD